MKTQTYQFSQGQLPLLISMPHNGSQIPADIAAKMHPYAQKSMDTDWFLDRLYGFAKDGGASLLYPFNSRYVIDLNRPQDDESLYPGSDTTELCPTTQFDRKPLYLTGCEPDKKEVERRVSLYWQPYHQKLTEELERMVKHYGFALLFEAHSIKSVVPRFFEGQLPDFNFGNFDQQSSSQGLTRIVEEWQAEGYTKVVNGRFKGGYITRHYGQPKKHIDSLQLELSQATYMHEETLEFDKSKASQVSIQLQDLISRLIDYAKANAA